LPSRRFEMGEQLAIRSVQFTNLLSFPDSTEPLRLGELNVLIGPNGSGKSNLIEAIGLLQGAPRDLGQPVREGGGIRDWLWRGAPQTPTATLEVVVTYPMGPMSLRYRLSFTEVGQRMEVIDERIENERPSPGLPKPYFYFGYENGRPMLNLAGGHRTLRREDIDPAHSVLSQRKDPDQYPEITYLGRFLESYRRYRAWTFGRSTPARTPQPADLPNDFLEENARNLGLIINRLRTDATAKRSLLKYLRALYDEADDLDIRIVGGTVQVFLQERSFVIPATRLSDGTLRWTALLVILLHPTPPPVVCIEEPEIGLHPDMMPTLARLLREASQRMQLIVTTHSDALVDELSDTPEAVIVCEKEAGGTRLRRLDRAELSVWLSKYTLGQLWRKGEIGGNRW
jgi:predicted ATPase